MGLAWVVGLGFHVGAEDGVDPGLVAFAVFFEPLDERPSGAEAPFLIVCALRGAEAPLFHSCAGGRGASIQSQNQGQRQRTGVSAPHEHFHASTEQIPHRAFGPVRNDRDLGWASGRCWIGLPCRSGGWR
jgi:hypothetical protein